MELAELAGIVADELPILCNVPPQSLADCGGLIRKLVLDVLLACHMSSVVWCGDGCIKVPRPRRDTDGGRGNYYSKSYSSSVHILTLLGAPCAFIAISLPPLDVPAQSPQSAHCMPCVELGQSISPVPTSSVGESIRNVL